MTNQPKTSKVTKVSTSEEFVEIFGKPGNAIHSNINDETYIAKLLAMSRTITTTTTAPSIPISNGGTGANTSSSFFNSQYYGRVRVPLTPGGPNQPFDIAYVSDLINADQELTQLIEEQPSVKEAYERLQVLIRMYRE